MHYFKNSVLTTTAVTLALCAPQAFAQTSLEKAFREGTAYLDARYRYEFVDQDGLSDDAHASTLRTRLGFKSGEVHNFSGVLEFENITEVGNDSYNNTVNGNSTRPVVADVASSEVNQAYLKFTGIPNSAIKLGRQVIALDNQRFVGHVGWRQNNQTYDAVTLSNQSLSDTKFTYGYISNVNRIFSNESSNGDWESNSHLINISNESTPLGKITGYGYFLDFENDAPAVSSKTFGISLNGKQALSEAVTFKYHAEYAYQSDHGDNTTDYDANYYHVAPALAFGGLTATLGYEVLGSDGGNIAFSTPLATLHKYNGFADKFLSTPANGLKDAYIDLTYKVSGMSGSGEILNGLLVKGQYHDFSADEGSSDYGTEFDMYLKKPFYENYYVEAKYANYDADQFATDTQKFIFGIGAKF